MADPPIGIWWQATPFDYALSSYYPVPELPEEVMARQAMLAKIPAASWADYWTQLSERAPYFCSYEIADIAEVWTPPQYLDMLIRAGQRGA